MCSCVISDQMASPFPFSDRRPSNILLFPAGTGISLEIWKGLRHCKEVRLFGASSSPSHADYLFKDVDFVPSIEEEGWLATLNTVIDRRNIDFIFPAYDDVLVALAKANHTGSLHATFIGSPLETSLITRSKSQTYRYLDGVVRTPKMYSSPSEISHFPVFLKPDRGQGSQYTHLVRDERELQIILSKRDDYLILEHLPGKEYTVDCFTSRSRGLLYCGGRERIKIKSGVCVESQHVDNPAFQLIAEKISARLQLRGAWFFQLKETSDGELALLEIAPRIGGTMSTHRVLGVNFPLLSLYEACDADVNVEPIPAKNISISRSLTDRYSYDISFDTVYIDFDDCLLIHNQVNTHLLSFLYQTLQNGKRLVLLTRHATSHNEPIQDALNRHHIAASLFDKIIDVPAGTMKSSFVKDKNSIFIDDSFRERTDMSQRVGIPTFDPSMVDLLIDTRV